MHAHGEDAVSQVNAPRSGASETEFAMPLIQCHDCQQEISDAAPACIFCGAPVGPSAGMYLWGASTPATTDCPSCGAGDTQRLERVWESGLAHIETRVSGGGVGVGARGFGVGVGGGTAYGSQQTLASQRAAPPTKRRIPTAVVVLVVLLGGPISQRVFGYRATLLPLCILVVIGIYFAYWNRTTWRRMHREWMARWMCNRCGNVWSVN